MKHPFNKSRMNIWKVSELFLCFKRHINWLTCRPRPTTAQSAERPWETMMKKRRRKTSMTMIMNHCLMVSRHANVSFISTRIHCDYLSIERNFLFCSLTLSQTFTVLTMTPSLCSMLTFFHPLHPPLSLIPFTLFFSFFVADVLNASTASYGQEGKCTVCEHIWVVGKRTWFQILFKTLG